MSNGEKATPLEALPTQERITQVLGERAVGVQEDETLSETVSRLGMYTYYERGWRK